MATVYLSLGSNLGDRTANLRSAVERLSQRCLLVKAISSVYETQPVGATEQPVPDYLNCVIAAETNLEPDALLKCTQAVEQAGGREPSFRWGPRTIDIDILWYDGMEIATDDLAIPHPRMLERAFVMIPLNEIAPDLLLPGGITPASILASGQWSDQKVTRSTSITLSAQGT